MIAQLLVEVPDELTDEDLAWLRAHACGVRVERSWPRVDVTPDENLRLEVLR